MKHCIHGLSINPHSKEEKCLVCISPTSGDDELSRLRQRVEELEADAERYRWLKDSGYTISYRKKGVGVHKPLTNYEYELHKTLDAAIDAEMEAGEPT